MANEDQYPGVWSVLLSCGHTVVVERRDEPAGDEFCHDCQATRNVTEAGQI